MSFNAKNNLQLNRQLKVQKLSIPFVIVGSASSASVSISCDEPGILFLRTQGNDQITSALASGETASYSASPVDSTGVFNMLVRIQEPVNKIVSLSVTDRLRGTRSNVYLGAASPSVASNGSDIMLSCTSDVALNAANTLNACLEVEYIVDEHS